MSKNTWGIVIGIGLLVAAMVVGGLIARAAFPKTVHVTEPGKVQTHTTETDTTPFITLIDSLRDELAKKGIVRPTPPRRDPPSSDFFMPQRQMVYEFTYYGGDGTLTMSVFDSVSPHYKKEQWTGLNNNVSVWWDTVSTSWAYYSWETAVKTPAEPTPVKKKWSFWRPTISADIAWSPGGGLFVTTSPGLLVLGHLKVGPYARLPFDGITNGEWDKLELGASVGLVW